MDAIFSPETSQRSGANPWGLHRVKHPQGVFPQAAESLEVGLPIFPNELLLQVKTLHLDSASFHQLWQESEGQIPKIKQRIFDIVQRAGKMHNPVTNSGGMLLGEVAERGRDYPQDFSSGQKVASLVSLTSTPLKLEAVHDVDPQNGMVRVQGYAILFANSLAAALPEDFTEAKALSILDVCGAPARVAKMLGDAKGRVAVLGFGKAGRLSALAALDHLDPEQITVVDRAESSERAVRDSGLKLHFFLGDARRASETYEAMRAQGLSDFDWVVDTCNVAETETLALLLAKAGGKVLHFNMATQFQRAVLSAEALGRDVELVMGNGYTAGHWQYAFNLVRRRCVLAKFWGF